MQPQMMQSNSEYIESVLKKFDLKKIHRSRGGFTACCPFHENNNTPAFSMSDSGLWICFSCNERGNLKSFIRRLGGDINNWQENLKMSGIQLANASGVIKSSAPGTMPADFNTYSQLGKVPPSILKRLEWDTIDNFQLGASEIGKNKNRGIIPIYYKEKVVGYHGRALDESTVPKYYNSPGVDIKEYVFNYDSCIGAEEVIVVEGAFNAMSMWEKGFENTVATFGTKFTSSQMHRIFSLSPQTLVICFDRDTHKDRPGQRAAMSMAALTYQLIDTYIMPLPFDKDPNDLPASTLLECYNKRVKYDDLIKRRDDGTKP